MMYNVTINILLRTHFLLFLGLSDVLPNVQPYIPRAGKVGTQHYTDDFITEQSRHISLLKYSTHNYVSV